MAEALQAELARSAWAPAAWAALGEDSREAYDQWVRGARTAAGSAALDPRRGRPLRAVGLWRLEGAPALTRLRAFV